MTQAVEGLLCKLETLSSNPSPTGKKKKQKTTEFDFQTNGEGIK
jgi:hypothetical protein